MSTPRETLEQHAETCGGCWRCDFVTTPTPAAVTGDTNNEGGAAI
jgi:hypothetical protein